MKARKQCDEGKSAPLFMIKQACGEKNKMSQVPYMHAHACRLCLFM